MATMATASTVAAGSPFGSQQPLGYPTSSASFVPLQPATAGPAPNQQPRSQAQSQAIHRRPDPFSQMPTADALFEALANQNSQDNSIVNPLSVHVQQLPTPRTSFSSGANSPPENLSPSIRGDVHHLSHHHTAHPYLTPTSLSASSSCAPSSATTPQPTFQSTIASTTTNATSVLGQGAASLPSPARSPLSTGHLYQPQSYPSLRAASPAMNSNPYPTLGPALYGPSATVHGSTGVYNTNGTLGGRQQSAYGEMYQQQDQQGLYYDDEKEQQKRNARDALNGVATYLPPVLNQGLSKVIQSAQAAVQASNSKMSLPSSRSQMDGGMRSSSIPSIESKSQSEVIRKLYKASKLPLLCLMWYLSSAVTNNIGKQIMNQFRYPVTLTFVQFLFVSLFCFLGGSVFRLTTIRRPTWGIVSMTAPLVGFQVVGHVFSSFAISRVPLSVVHTIKVKHGRV